MSDLDYIKKQNVKRHSPIWPEIPDVEYKLLEVLDLEKQMH